MQRRRRGQGAGLLGVAGAAAQGGGAEARPRLRPGRHTTVAAGEWSRSTRRPGEPTSPKAQEVINIIHPGAARTAGRFAPLRRQDTAVLRVAGCPGVGRPGGGVELHVRRWWDEGGSRASPPAPTARPQGQIHGRSHGGSCECRHTGGARHAGCCAGQVRSRSPPSPQEAEFDGGQDGINQASVSKGMTRAGAVAPRWQRRDSNPADATVADRHEVCRGKVAAIVILRRDRGKVAEADTFGIDPEVGRTHIFASSISARRMQNLVFFFVVHIMMTSRLEVVCRTSKARTFS